MAENQEKQNALSSDELLDQLAAEVGLGHKAEAAEAQENVQENREARSADQKSEKKRKKAASQQKPSKKAPKPEAVLTQKEYYQKSIELLKPHGGAEVDLSSVARSSGKTHGVLNFFLILLMLGVGGAGFYYFYTISNQEALDLRRARLEERRLTQLEEQMAKQKRYGIMRIESDPPQALIYKNGKPIVAPKPGAPECVDDASCSDGMMCDLESKHCGDPAKTPTNISDVNIVQIDKYELKLAGYEDFDFHVSEHLWTKDSAAGDYRLLKVIDMNELPCEYWFIFDSAKGEEQKYETRRDCDKAHKAAETEHLSVTECTCKALPEPAENAETATTPAP